MCSCSWSSDTSAERPPLDKSRKKKTHLPSLINMKRHKEYVHWLRNAFAVCLPSVIFFNKASNAKILIKLTTRKITATYCLCMLFQNHFQLCHCDAVAVILNSFGFVHQCYCYSVMVYLLHSFLTYCISTAFEKQQLFLFTIFKRQR